jgi:myo-inositol 2-dehydrogenase/D-chiro-inositol 1-dehydrogenase
MMVNIVMVGAGGIAKTHSSSLMRIATANIVGVVDPNEERAQTLASAVGASTYKNLEDCVERADVVYILTPPSTHRELALKAINAGKHVVCEKPISISLDDAEAMVQAAKQANVKLMIAFNNRFRKGFRRLREMANAGTLGKLVNMWSQRIGPGIPQGYNWRTDPQLMCGMSIESLSHDIDLIRWIAGEIVDVRANIVVSNPDIEGFDDNAHVVLTLSNGGTAVIHASWSSHLGMNARGVIGTLGTAVVDGPGLWAGKHFRWQTCEMEHEHIEVIDDSYATSDCYEMESRHFINCIANDLPPTITGVDGLEALKVSHAILDSHHKKEVIFL